MKTSFKKNFVLLLILLPLINYAQLGVGNLDPKSTLDVEASNAAAPLNTDGVLIPRINAFPATNPGADQNAMLVYLNVASGANPIGFYYWNNVTTSWLPLASSSNAWDVLGNSGTLSGTNFIGTTDLQALDFRTNNLIRARITTKGQLEIFNTGNSVFVGEGAGANDDLANRQNTFVGANSGNANTTGVVNTAIGIQALANATTGTNNTALGGFSGANINGNDNVTIGYKSDEFNQGGSQNVVIGSEAGLTTGTGNNNDGNVLIGYNAAKDIASSNSLYLENSSSVTPLVYGEFDNNIVRIGGQLQIGSSDNVTNNSIYAFPTVDGTAGQALVTDGSGVVSWESLASVTDNQALSIDNDIAEIKIQNVATGITVSTIADADSDTKIQVDKGAADDDIIRLDLAGVETVTFDGAKINTINTGGSTFLGNGAGAADDLTNNRTTFIGFEAGNFVTTGVWNTAIGYQALSGGRAVPDPSNPDPNPVLANTRGNSNTMIGYHAGYNTSTNNNVGIGRWVLRNNTPNSSGSGANVGIGGNNSSYKFGTGNVAIGNASMGVINSGTDFLDGNVAIGDAASFILRSGVGNISIGQNAADFIERGNHNISIGYQAARRVKNGSSNNIMIGRQVGGNSTSVTDLRTMKNSILLGFNAGFLEDEGAEDRLYIEQSGSRTPLIGGDFANNRVGINVDMTTTGAATGVAPDALTHTLTVGGSVKIQTLMNLEPSTAPATPSRGDVYYDNATNKVRVWTGAAWENLN